MAAADKVNLIEGQRPDLYHCSCRFCTQVIGELRPVDSSYYSRLERRKYYDHSQEKTHVARTPLHIARWAVQAYTKLGDWVLDPTIGAGTTAVEALTQGRNAAGMEVQYEGPLKANVSKHLREGLQARIRIGDARDIREFLFELGLRFSLVVNNPPYSGDESQKHMDKEVRERPELEPTKDYRYGNDLPNLAFLKEGPVYWETIRQIYSDCADYLAPGGAFVVGVKDMMRDKKPFTIHHEYCKILEGIPGMEFEGTAFLKHYPTTLFLNTYHKKTGVHPPYYQTISVFRKRNEIQPEEDITHVRHPDDPRADPGLEPSRPD